ATLGGRVLDAAAVLADDLLADGEAEAGAAGVAGGEQIEEPPLEAGGDAGAGVGELEAELVARGGSADGEAAAVLHGLERVARQVVDEPEHRLLIEVGDAVVLDLEDQLDV